MTASHMIRRDIGAQRHQRRAGFTVLEVSVVLAVLGLMAAIALPAISAARETSRRMQCAWNLHQVMLAFHNFEQAHRCFPGVFHDGQQEWTEAILPDIEQPELVRDSQGRQVRGPELVPIYRCPGDPVARGLVGEPSYWMNVGTTWEAANGMYRNHHRPVRAGDVTDGLSATATIAERLVHQDVRVPASDETAWRHRMVRMTSSVTSDLRRFCEVCERESFQPTDVALYSIGGYVHVQTPNKNSCTNGPRMGPSGAAAITTVSGHPGGVNVAMADGAVQFITDDIDYDVWWQMGSRDGTDAPYDH